MDFTFQPLSDLDAGGLANLAGLHCSVMHTLLADLGAPLVLRYYEIAQREPGVLGLCATDPAGGISAWAIGSPDPGALNARLRQPLNWFAGQMLGLVFTHPRALLELFGSVFSGADVNKPAPGQIELTYIGVAAGAQRQGLGRAILTAFIDSARSAGYKTIVLSVETDNPPAIALYTKTGFQITKTFREGHFERHRMAYRLI